jgi:hypothetical protein
MLIRLISAFTAAALLSGAPLVHADTAMPAEPQAAIDYILAQVAKSDLEFVRNGKAHTPPEAVKHMRRKYEYYENQIDTPEEFIELAATKSILSGKPYTIRTADGEVPAADWLLSVLAEYRAQQDSSIAGSE